MKESKFEISMETSSGGKKGIKKSEFVTKTQC